MDRKDQSSKDLLVLLVQVCELMWHNFRKLLVSLWVTPFVYSFPTLLTGQKGPKEDYWWLKRQRSENTLNIYKTESENLNPKQYNYLL